MKTIACIIARTNSTRLPEKVLREVISEVKLIEYLISKVKKAKQIDEIYLCTSIDKNDEILLEIAKKNNIKFYAGSKDSVIDRMLEVAKIENADNVVRITGDNIFTDEIYLDLMMKYHLKNFPDYTRTEYLPIGITSEIIKVSALKKCKEQMNPNESQYLLLYIFQPENFKCQVLIPEKKHSKPTMTFTVDTPEDFERTLKLVEEKKEGLLNFDEILNICKSKDIPNTEYEAGAAVRFPSNLIFSFKAFRTEMDMRIENSTKIFLEKNEYSETLKQYENN